MARLTNMARGQNRPESTELQRTSTDPSRRASGVQARAARVQPSGVPDAEQTLLVSISCPVQAALLEPTYAYLSTYAATCLGHAVAQRLNVAIYELLANALSYGTPSENVRLEIHRTNAGVRLTLTNDAAAADISKLAAHVARVQKDPMAAFAQEMSRFAANTPPQPMLGFVRIAHKSALAVELLVEGTRVSVTALCPA